MNEKIFLFSILVTLSGAFLGSTWSHYSELPNNEFSPNRTESSKLNKSLQYCFHFTWMGGKFNNMTFKNIRNKTCAQYFKDKKTLCINPMVATWRGKKPDLDYILDNHPEEATCRLSQEHTCVKYTVYYNGIISYETRYCAIVNIEMESPMESGCIQEKRGSQLIEVCACKSQPGRDGICNSAPQIPLAKFTLLTSFLIYVYKFCLFDNPSFGNNRY